MDYRRVKIVSAAVQVEAVQVEARRRKKERRNSVQGSKRPAKVWPSKSTGGRLSTCGRRRYSHRRGEITTHLATNSENYRTNRNTV